jgi:hypothetical protein
MREREKLYETDRVDRALMIVNTVLSGVSIILTVIDIVKAVFIR